MKQDEFDLGEALLKSTHYAGFTPCANGMLLQKTIARFLGQGPG
jgi:hypothetical protein